jgi:L-fucose isomerase-like protein
METSPEFLEKSFLLTEIFRDCLEEAQTDALTIGSCMHAVMPVSETTACMPLSILNDEGYLALCEADFQSIPAGVLLHYISGKPVFMGNGSFPYAGEVLLSHCTAPSRMDGCNDEPVRVVTHYESDFGAAPKVNMRKGQQVTVLDADFAGKRILGFRGEITDTPFYPMCRTQLEIAVRGDIVKLREELQGWHWMLCYDDHLQEVEYAVRKAGLEWAQV